MATESTLKKTTGMVSGLLLATAYFLSWVQWDGTTIAGSDFANGRFFAAAEKGYGLSNPFPEYAFANMAFWLIPILAVLSIVLIILKKSPGILAAMAGSLALALATIYYLFRAEELHQPIPGSMVIGYWVSVLSAILIILTSWSRQWLWKTLFIVAPVAITYIGYQQVKSAVMNEKVSDTTTLKTDYKTAALDFIQEFTASDSAANAKYREKTIELTGMVSEVTTSDSTATISFADSTGSYAIFDMDKGQVAEAKKITTGKTVTVKGVCSGGVYSDILGTETISFKHAIIIDPKK